MLYKPHSLLAVQYKIQWLSYIFCSVLWGKYLKKSLKLNDLGLDIIGRVSANERLARTEQLIASVEKDGVEGIQTEVDKNSLDDD